VQDKIDAVKTARASEDPATIASATEALSAVMMKIGEAMAKAQSAGAGGSETPPPSEGGGPGPDSGGGETPPATDAEFKEKP